MDELVQQLDASGLDHRTPAQTILTEFIHAAYVRNTNDDLPNFGNVGENFAHLAQTNAQGWDDVVFAQEPWLIGSMVPAYQYNAMWMPTLTDGKEQWIRPLNFIERQGALLVHFRLKPEANGYDAVLFNAGFHTYGAVPSDPLSWCITNNGGQLRWRGHYKRAIGGVAIVDLPALGVGGEHSIVILFDGVAEEIVVYVDGLVGGTYDISAYSGDNWNDFGDTDFGMEQFGMGLTIGGQPNRAPPTGPDTPGTRTYEPNNYGDGPHTDWFFADVTANRLQVVANMPAIARAFTKTPLGYLPSGLKGLIE